MMKVWQKLNPFPCSRKPVKPYPTGKTRSNKGPILCQRDFSHVGTLKSPSFKSKTPNTKSSTFNIFVNLLIYLLLLCLFSRIHLLVFWLNFNSVCCCLEIASLLVAVEVLLILLRHSLINSRLERFNVFLNGANIFTRILTHETISTRLFDKKTPHRI